MLRSALSRIAAAGTSQLRLCSRRPVTGSLMLLSTSYSSKMYGVAYNTQGYLPPMAKDKESRSLGDSFNIHEIMESADVLWESHTDIRSLLPMYEDLLLYMMEEFNITVDGMLKVLYVMKQRVKVDVEHYNTVLEKILNTNPPDYPGALDFMKEMVKAGFAKQMTPSCYVFARRCHPDFHENSQSLKYLEELYKFMNFNEIPHSNETFAEMINGFSKFGRLDLVEEMMRRASFWKVRLTSSMEASHLQILIERDMFERAFEKFWDLQSRGIVVQARMVMKMFNCVCRAAANGVTEIHGKTLPELLQELTHVLHRCPNVEDYKVFEVTLNTMRSVLGKRNSESMWKVVRSFDSLLIGLPRGAVRELLVFHQVLETALALKTVTKSPEELAELHAICKNIFLMAFKRRIQVCADMLELYLALMKDWTRNGHLTNLAERAEMYIDDHFEMRMYSLFAVAESLVVARLPDEPFRFDETLFAHSLSEFMKLKANEDEEVFENLRQKILEEDRELKLRPPELDKKILEQKAYDDVKKKVLDIFAHEVHERVYKGLE